jgi:hypothetical protein
MRVCLTSASYIAPEIKGCRGQGNYQLQEELPMPIDICKGKNGLLYRNDPSILVRQGVAFRCVAEKCSVLVVRCIMFGWR